MIDFRQNNAYYYVSKCPLNISNSLKEQKKKRIVVVLLLISCFISGYMFFNTAESSFQKLDALARADSLIKKELSRFNINKQQIKIVTVKVDSNLSRKTYLVDVPPAFSKTQFHAELNQTFYNYSVKTPAKVTFPERNIKIYLFYHDTVIRTIKLRTNNNLVTNRKQSSILMAFNSAPDNKLISKLISLGEPIPIVLKIENPMQANELNKQLSNRYNRILFWLQDEESKDLIRTDPVTAAEKLDQLQRILPTAMMLKISTSDETQKLVSKANLTFIDAADALILDEEMGKASFFKALNQLKTNQTYSLVIIKGNETTLNWFSEKLSELKKAGVHLMPPPAMNI